MSDGPKHVVEIFTPSHFPTWTYVHRDPPKVAPGDLPPPSLEERLREAITVPGEIISLSGPSKSGKTVLVERVVGTDNLIPVTGADVQSAEQVWDKILDKIDAPASTTSTKSTMHGQSATVAAKGQMGLPLVASGEIEGSGTVDLENTKATGDSRNRTGLAQVIRDLSGTKKVVLIDDFHYMEPDVQRKVVEQIKEAARAGVKICVASVPHKSDAMIRANSELKGRVRSIDTAPWTESELVKIGEVGFPLAGLHVPSETILQIAREASSSPQLMQTVCLDLCRVVGIASPKLPAERRDFTGPELRAALREAATRSAASTLVSSMHAGAKTRGTERKDFVLNDGSTGDVYRALLLALKADPPRLSFDWNELSRRVQAVCAPGKAPSASSLATACSIVAQKARKTGEVEWDGEPNNLFTIADPYFLFYLRWSTILRDLTSA